MHFSYITGSVDPQWSDISPSDVLCSVICVFGVVILAKWLFAKNPIRRLDDAPQRNNTLQPLLPFVMIFSWVLLISIFYTFVKKYFGDETALPSQIASSFGLLAVELVMICVFLVVASRHFDRGITGYGLDFSTFITNIKFGFLNYLAIFPLILAILWMVVFLASVFTGQDFQMPKNQSLEMIIQSDSLLLKSIVVISAGFIVPIFEEMLFRGMLQSMIVQYVGSKWISILLTSVIFVFMHPASLWTHWPALAALSICMGYAYEKSGSLLRPITIHILFNSINIASTFIG